MIQFFERGCLESNPSTNYSFEYPFALTTNRKKKLYNNFREYLVSLDDERADLL